MCVNSTRKQCIMEKRLANNSERKREKVKMGKGKGKGKKQEFADFLACG